MQSMNGLTISVSWEYFLGVMGALIAVAYYTNGRLTGLETSVQWLTDVSTPEQNCIGWPEQKCITGYEAAEEVLSGTDGGLFGRAERSSPIAA
jgi:hypothetical protein